MWGRGLHQSTVTCCLTCGERCVCRVQWHVVSYRRGRWSCSCVVCWKDKATARVSGGWRSTSTELTLTLMCGATQCPVLTTDWLVHPGAFPLPTCVCVSVAMLMIWAVCSNVAWNRRMFICQFIGQFVRSCMYSVLSLCIHVECCVKCWWWVSSLLRYISVGSDVICIWRNSYMSLQGS